MLFAQASVSNVRIKYHKMFSPNEEPTKKKNGRNELIVNDYSFKIDEVAMQVSR